MRNGHVVLSNAQNPARHVVHRDAQRLKLEKTVQSPQEIAKKGIPDAEPGFLFVLRVLSRLNCFLLSVKRCQSLPAMPRRPGVDSF